jgi:hypothetical protein
MYNFNKETLQLNEFITIQYKAVGGFPETARGTHLICCRWVTRPTWKWRNSGNAEYRNPGFQRRQVTHYVHWATQPYSETLLTFQSLVYVPTCSSFKTNTFCPHIVLLVCCLTDLNTNSDCFLQQHWLIAFYNRGEVCLLGGTDSNTVELHLSVLNGTVRHSDMRKIRIIGSFVGNMLHWQFEVRLLLFILHVRTGVSTFRLRLIWSSRRHKTDPTSCNFKAS